MNWNQYFKLREKQRKLFWVFFVILILINLFYIKDFIKQGPEYICDKINASCNDYDLTYELMIGQNEIDNKAGINNAGQNITNTALESNNTNISIESSQELNTSIIIDNSSDKTETIKQKNKYLNYLWFDCNFDCNNLALSTKVTVWSYRLRYTPLFIVTDFIVAYILSLMTYGFGVLRLEHKKDKQEEPEQKEEKKQEPEKK